jgi:KUP system potassium uptake protein
VFLAVTGAEALYADLGHFGRGPIRIAWLWFVFPALIINYLGQGALVLARPDALENPFFRLYPDWALLPMVGIATIATIIASQAVITGAFSMTQQAIQLGLLPRLDIRPTSESARGQIYMPAVNWLLLLAVLFLVLGFKSSGALASAYGIAVTGTMIVTVLLAFVVAWRLWNWPLWAAALVMLPFLVIDVVFLGANLTKVLEGGWLPLLVGSALAAAMLTWRRGSGLLARKTRREEIPLADFAKMLERKVPHRVPGTAVFLTKHPELVPTALLHNLKHNKALHERVIIVSIATSDTPRVPAAKRAQLMDGSDLFTVVTLNYGYMEEPNLPQGLEACRRLGINIEPAQASFFLSRRALRPATRSEMPRWQDRFFVWLARRGNDASAYFQIPADRAVEVGTQVVI